MSRADRLTQEEANAVIRLVETLRADQEGIPISELAGSLNLPESYVRDLVEIVRDPHGQPRPRRIGFLAKIWHLTIGLSGVVVLWAAVQMLISFPFRSSIGLGDFALLFVYVVWVGIILCYYRHVLMALLTKIADGFKP